MYIGITEKANKKAMKIYLKSPMFFGDIKTYNELRFCTDFIVRSFFIEHEILFILIHKNELN